MTNNSSAPRHKISVLKYFKSDIDHADQDGPTALLGNRDSKFSNNSNLTVILQFSSIKFQIEKPSPI